MTRKKYVFLELLCVAALAAFIVLLCTYRSGGTQKEIGEVAAPVAKLAQEAEMSEKTNADIAKTFGIDAQLAEGMVYYANDNIMDVSEVLLVKLKDTGDASAVKALIEQRVADQKNLYKNYAPAQYALLGECIIEVSGNTVFYCTAKNADAIYEAYKKAL